MPIEKGSRAAHERAVKAAETRRYNKIRAGHSFGPVPSYNATAERRHNPKAPKLRKPLTRAGVKKASNDELRREMEYWGHIPGSRIRTRAQDNAYYAAKEELRSRAYPRIGVFVAEHGKGRKAKAHKIERLEAHRMRRGVRKERGKK